MNNNYWYYLYHCLLVLFIDKDGKNPHKDGGPWGFSPFEENIGQFYT